jgi:hypothetical protein
VMYLLESMTLKEAPQESYSHIIGLLDLSIRGRTLDTGPTRTIDALG